MNASPLHRCVFVACLLVLVFLSAPVRADASADMLGQARDLVQQAAQATSDDARLKLVTQALQLAQQTPEHRLQGHRVKAIQDLHGALTQIRAGDPDHTLANDLTQAVDELKLSLDTLRALHSRLPSTAPADSSAPVAPPPSATPESAPPSAPEPSASTPPPAPAFAATNASTAAIPPEVTPEMEQAFLAKYKAAIDKQDLDAFVALIANDPQLDAAAKQKVHDFAGLGLALDASNPNRTYEFVPVPPGAGNPPFTVGDKTYANYLPPVAALKIKFGPPPPSSPLAMGDATVPLCIQNHQLMLVGSKLDPNAPTPAQVAKKTVADNFGFTPKIRTVKADTNATDDFGNNFGSLDEFLAGLKQPRLEILASGENKFSYYALCRVDPNLFVYAIGDHRGDVNYGFSVLAATSSQPPNDATDPGLKGEPKYIKLLEDRDAGQDAGDDSAMPSIQGNVFKIPPGYSGPITVECQYNGGAGPDGLTVLKTVLWK